MQPASGSSLAMKEPAPRKGHEYSWWVTSVWLSQVAAFQNPVPAVRLFCNHHEEVSKTRRLSSASIVPHPDRLRSPEAVWKSEASSGDRRANLRVSAGL